MPKDLLLVSNGPDEAPSLERLLAKLKISNTIRRLHDKVSYYETLFPLASSPPAELDAVAVIVCLDHLALGGLEVVELLAQHPATSALPRLAIGAVGSQIGALPSSAGKTLFLASPVAGTDFIEALIGLEMTWEVSSPS
jgi:hypothetical protein